MVRLRTRRWAMPVKGKMTKASPVRLLRPGLPHLLLPASARTLHLETGQDRDLILELPPQDTKLTRLSALTFVSKFTLLPVPRHATAMEDCHRAPKDWMIVGTGTLTSALAVVMEAALIMAGHLRVP